MKNMSGYNLIELLMVMAIVAIMAMIGIPSFRYVTTANRVSSEVNSLLGDMQYARNEAVKEGQTVTVCASANPTATPPSCSGTTAWHTGWIVFSDPGNSQTLPAGVLPLRVQSAFTAQDTFVANNNVQAVTFNREGFPNSGQIGSVSPISAGVTITLHDTTANSQWTRCLAINIASTNTVGMLATERVSAATPNCT
jgi:type IV fimbrial biogenesis protein FimT